MKNSPPPQSLLVIRLSAMGDIVIAAQVMQEIARQWPHCKITWVANEPFAPMLRQMPFIAEVIPFRKKDKLKGILALLRELRRRKFDMVWDLHGLLRPAMFTLLSGVRKRWGIRTRKGLRGLTYTRWVPPLAGDPGRHLMGQSAAFAVAAGLDYNPTGHLQLHPSPSYPWQSFFSSAPEENFVIVTDSSQAFKNWPYFDELTEKILAASPAHRVIWCGGKHTDPQKKFPPEQFLNLSGMRPMEELVALLRQPSLTIGNDTGPIHFSSACGNRVLAIFGPTKPEIGRPSPTEPSRAHVVVAPQDNLAALSATQVMSELQNFLASA